VPILTYHSLDESGSVISTAPDVFKEQIRLFCQWGYRAVRLSDLIDAWQGKVSLPRKPIDITFDDAFANVLEHAAPTLAAAGFPACLFAVADYCGKDNDWPSQPRDAPRLPTLSYAALRDLADAGFEIGAHTLTHPRLPRVDAATAEREIVRSKESLEDHTGQHVAVFAYPYGLAGAQHRKIAAQHFRAACGTTLRKARACDNYYALPRIDMYYLRQISHFRHFTSLRGEFYLQFRAFARSCRQFGTLH